MFCERSQNGNQFVWVFFFNIVNNLSPQIKSMLRSEPHPVRCAEYLRKIHSGSLIDIVRLKGWNIECFPIICVTNSCEHVDMEMLNYLQFKLIFEAKLINFCSARNSVCCCSEDIKLKYQILAIRYYSHETAGV